MTAVILPFPIRHVRIAREGPAWLVISRDHGWLHGSRADAAADARWLANNHGVPIIVRQQHKENDMAFQQKPNRGSLFKNTEKSKEEDRDYTGSLNIDGVEYWLSGWIKTSEKATKYLSISAKPKDAPAANQGKPRDSVDDENPF